MENLLQDIPKPVVYLDDILLTGSSEEEHLSTLQLILQRLKSADLKVRRDKCKFLPSSITYLGHRIDSEGLHPQDKMGTILNAPAPTSATELKSFLGLVSYYVNSSLTCHQHCILFINSLKHVPNGVDGGERKKF